LWSPFILQYPLYCPLSRWTPCLSLALYCLCYSLLTASSPTFNKPTDCVAFVVKHVMREESLLQCKPCASSCSLLTFSCIMTYICRTATLTSRRYILYIYSTNIRTEYFKHAAHSLFFPLQNDVYFIMLPILVPVLFIF
jgi:hypothetical protein